MPKKIRQIDKRDLVQSEIMKAVRADPLRTITYSELGAITDTGPRGPSKDLLDYIADQQTLAGLPDITVIVVRRDSGYPGQIDGKKTEKPTTEQKQRARAKMQEVIDKYNPGVNNPFFISFDS
ncbi:hypothetical protein MXD81_28215 [Microbacteriaceae bacterium K1510]|nr:hypothetical protein [Microbacteriaceae bacterium K1510]